jgi:hypothetical protein
MRDIRHLDLISKRKKSSALPDVLGKGAGR